MSDSPFTDAQIKRLRELAEARDGERERQSTFSHGEQGELDATAHGLGFNAKQTRQLNHRFRKRWLPLLGYLILAIGMAYAVGTSRDASVQAARQAQAQAIQHSNENRIQAVANTRQISTANCQSGNVTRKAIRDIIESGIPQTRKFIKDGTLTAAQGKAELTLSYKALHRLADRDCTALIKTLK